MMSDEEFAELELRATIAHDNVSGLSPSTAIGESYTRLPTKRGHA
jgi:hypothetical protein